MASSSSTATVATAKLLYRQLLREAHKMNDYNFREYAIRRVQHGFREAQTNQQQQQQQQQQGVAGSAVDGFSEQDKEKTQALLQQAQEQLALLKRQVVLGQMYPSATSVMDS